MSRQAGNENIEYVHQFGSGHTASIAQTGNGNWGNIYQQLGSDDIAVIAQTGNGNTGSAHQDGTGHTAMIIQTGNSNSAASNSSMKAVGRRR